VGEQGPPRPQGATGPQGLPGPQGQQGSAPQPGPQLQEAATRWTAPATSRAASWLTPGIELALTPVQIFASMFDTMVKLQQKTWASATGVANTRSRNANRD
jgi:hypothetical protein